MLKPKGLLLALAIVIIISFGAFIGINWWRSNAALPPPVGLQLIAEGFTSPVGLIPSPDDTGRLFIVDQVGVVKIISPDGKVLPEPFLDLRARMVTLNSAYDERGLLGLAFHPDFKKNGRFFVYYSAPLRPGGPPGWDHTSRVSEFVVSLGNPDRAHPASERIILEVDQPQSNHNGGQIVFGTDGYLYISLGDGGGANDVGLGHPPIGNGQDINTLPGSILRLDVDRKVPYGIPPDNPFVGRDGLDEIFAFGFRNPFRFSFDAGGQHELFAADAGQNRWEEVDIVERGGNYGWNIKEGAHFFNPANPAQEPASGPTTGAGGESLIDPIIEYPNAGGGGSGTAAIGGFVYRGTAFPRFQGAYIFGDFSAPGGADGRLFIATRLAVSGGRWDMGELKIRTSENGHLNTYLRAIGQDASLELYALVADTPGPQGNTGKIYRIVP